MLEISHKSGYISSANPTIIITSFKNSTLQITTGKLNGENILRSTMNIIVNLRCGMKRIQGCHMAAAELHEIRYWEAISLSLIG